MIPLIIKETQESQEPILTELFYVTRKYVFKIFGTRKYAILVSAADLQFAIVIIIRVLLMMHLS